MTLLTFHQDPAQHTTTPAAPAPGTTTTTGTTTTGSGTGTGTTTTTATGITTGTATAAPHPAAGTDPATTTLTGTPSTSELSRLLYDTDGPDHSHDTWRELVSRDEFRYNPHLTRTERIAQSYRRLRLINDTLDNPEELAQNPGRLAALHEWIGFTDGGLCTVASIHYNLFLGSLLDHPDPTH
ncbi:hypothetical protein GTU99_33920, partial [Streptomyces sp. PRKS01-65]|nr:hypothetical protein [Streptomyces harenosi]